VVDKGSKASLLYTPHIITYCLQTLTHLRSSLSLFLFLWPIYRKHTIIKMVLPKPLFRFLKNAVKSPLRETLAMRIFGAYQVGLIGYVRPSVLSITQERIDVLLKLNKRTRNHVNGMYFGSMAIGADLSCATLAVHNSLEREMNVIPLFTDFDAKYFRKATGDVIFRCDDGVDINKKIDEAMETNKRVFMKCKVMALPAETENQNDPYAEFNMGLTLKKF